MRWTLQEEVLPIHFIHDRDTRFPPPFNHVSRATSVTWGKMRSAHLLLVPGGCDDIARVPTETVAFIDEYAARYRDLFAIVPSIISTTTPRAAVAAP
jgi:hypothetical protein